MSSVSTVRLARTMASRDMAALMLSDMLFVHVSDRRTSHRKRRDALLMPTAGTGTAPFFNSL